MKKSKPLEKQTPATLAPARDVQKFLISASCHLQGRFANDALMISDAQPSLGNFRQRMRMDDKNSSRTGLALVFRTNPADQGGIIIPQYDSAAELVCSVLSLLYGKRFDNHGAVENSGFFYLPNLRALDLDHDRRLPQNGNQPRADFCFALDLTEVRRVLPILFSQSVIAPISAFRSAIKFYHQALIAAEQDIEVAYLHLVTVGEILSGTVELHEDCLVDSNTRQLLHRIEGRMNDDGAAARQVRSKLRSVRRRFVAGLRSLIQPLFFSVGEASHQSSRFDETTMPRRLAAAYDLRSRYLHTGQTFGDWIGPRGLDKDELQHGKPVVSDRAFASALAAAPTYVGLERLMRYCLLRQLEKHGLDLAAQQTSPQPT